MNGNCENFALKAQFIDRAVTFVNAEYLRVKRVEGTQMEFDRIDFANSVRADGTLDWKGRPGHWVLKEKGDTLQIIVEQGDYVARDMKGNIVPLE